jgi:uncharacterized protein (DUF305 family)
MSTAPADAPFDLQFVDTMTVHHQEAIEMARAALERAEHSEIKQLSDNIITAQQAEIAKMKQMRDDWYPGRPLAENMEMSGMKMTMQGMDMDKLRSLTGAEFDLEFCRQMIVHHTGALMMANEAIEKAEKNETKSLAADIIKSQSAEIQKMQQWQKSWSK